MESSGEASVEFCLPAWGKDIAKCLAKAFMCLLYEANLYFLLGLPGWEGSCTFLSREVTVGPHPTFHTPLEKHHMPQDPQGVWQQRVYANGFIYFSAKAQLENILLKQ